VTQLLGPADIRRLAEQLGVRPTKTLGQNFVIDPNTVRRIVRVSGVGPADTVLEIGPGLGSLTLALLPEVAAVTAVEIDPVLAGALPATVAAHAPESAGRLQVIEADALRLRPEDLPAAPSALVANLPYNVATPLVMRVLTEVPAVSRLLVMVQREVGERMAARVGDPAYGSVSVRVDYFAQATVVGRVPASVFVPRPRVESVLVRLERRAVPAVDPALVPYERLAAVIRAGFGQRRKMLRRSLAGVVTPEAFERAGIRPDARAEELDVEAWGRLAQ
jgi:16S rRNA (adenine1518-N6/adenine1519-N6)-dimethyltransferase